MHNQELPDLNLIKRQAKAQRKEGGGMTYMQGRDAASHLQYYLRTVQEYYPDF